jgi:hypothetical protein
MKISRRETILLAGTVAIVAAVLLGGVWVSQQKAEKIATRMGRYQLVYDLNIRGPLTTKTDPILAIDLKPSGQWILYRSTISGTVPFITGTYSLSGEEITFKGSFGNPSKLWDDGGIRRLTKDGFVMPYKNNGFSMGGHLISFHDPRKNFRFVKLSQN